MHPMLDEHGPFLAARAICCRGDGPKIQPLFDHGRNQDTKNNMHLWPGDDYPSTNQRFALHQPHLRQANQVADVGSAMGGIVEVKSVSGSDTYEARLRAKSRNSGEWWVVLSR